MRKLYSWCRATQVSHESPGSGSDGSARAGRCGLAHAGFRDGKGASGLDAWWGQEAPGLGREGLGLTRAFLNFWELVFLLPSTLELC